MRRILAGTFAVWAALGADPLAATVPAEQTVGEVVTPGGQVLATALGRAHR